LVGYKDLMALEERWGTAAPEATQPKPELVEKVPELASQKLASQASQVELASHVAAPPSLHQAPSRRNNDMLSVRVPLDLI